LSEQLAPDRLLLQAPDRLFRVVRLDHSTKPQTLAWQAMHQDYSEEAVADEPVPGSEQEAGEILVKHLLKGEKGHYGPLEHPSITFNVIGFPHDLMQQARTHRVGVSFDVQSGRYTSQRIVDVVTGKRPLEEVFYLRPVGTYHDRFGKKYDYSEHDRECDFGACVGLATTFAVKIDLGMAEEHARGLIPYCIRQHFVVSFNARSLMHFMDLRAKADAQLEIRQLSAMLFAEFKDWVPQIAEYYETKRLGRALLAP
jgi:thymidylate synthase (FAD)